MTLASPPTAASDAPRTGTAWFLRPRGFVFAILLLQLLHMALRPLLTPTAGTDDVDQLLFSQVFRAGYSYEQPPLYTWLLWAVSALVGPSVLAVGLVRYGLVFLIHLFCYLGARRLVVDPRLQVAIGFTPTLLYPIGWRLHEADTHAIAASVLVLALVWSVLGLLQRRRSADYLVFGLALGLGLLSSGYFVVAAGTALLALLFSAAGRGVLLHWRMLPALLLAVLLALPYALWIEAQGEAFWFGVDEILRRAQPEAGPEPWYISAYYGAKPWAETTFPFWIIFAVLFWYTLRPLPRGTVAADPRARFLWAYVGLGVVACTLVPVVLEIHRILPFRLYPVTLPLILLLFWRLERFGYWTNHLRWYGIVIGIFVIVVIQARFQHIEAGPAFCKACRMQAPYPEVARLARQAGYDGGGTIVTGDNYVAGNFRIQFPDARVVTPRFAEFAPPRQATPGPCLVVWHDDANAGNMEVLETYLADLGVVLPPLDEVPLHSVPIPHTTRIEVPRKTIEMRFVLYPEGAGSCQ